MNRDFLRIFRKIIKFPKRVITSDFVWHWRRSRPGGHFLAGLPSLLIALLMLGVTLYARSNKEEVLPRVMLQQAVRAKSLGDQGLSNVYIEKAGRLDIGNGQTQLENARWLIAAGRPDQALSIIKGLTPPDGKGFAPARKLMISTLQQRLTATLEDEDAKGPADSLADDSKDPTTPTQPVELSPETLAKRLQLLNAIQIQCERLIEENPDSRLAQDQLAGLYFRQGRFLDASVMLSKLVSASEEFRSFYAQALSNAGQPIQAKGQAQMAAIYHRRMLREFKDNPSDDEKQARHKRYHHLSRLCLSLTLAQEYREAALLLMRDLKKEEADDPVLRKLLVDVLVIWADSMAAINVETGDLNEELLGHRLMLLESALNYSQGDPRLLLRLGAIAGVDGSSAEKARASLRRMAKDGSATPTIHFALGVSAIKDGDVANATAHFEMANEKSPGTPSLLNNLAYTMAQAEDADLNQALSLINEAIEAAPKNPELYDTRGMILVKQKKWNPAVKDLLFAIQNGVRDMIAPHENLLLAFEALDQQAKATAIRKRLAVLKK